MWWCVHLRPCVPQNVCNPTAVSPTFFLVVHMGPCNKWKTGRVGRHVQNFHASIAHMRLKFCLSMSTMPFKIATGRIGMRTLAPSVWESIRQRQAKPKCWLFFTFGMFKWAPKFFTETVDSLASLPPFLSFLFFFFCSSSGGGSRTKTNSFVWFIVWSVFFRLWWEMRTFTLKVGPKIV